MNRKEEMTLEQLQHLHAFLSKEADRYKREGYLREEKPDESNNDSEQESWLRRIWKRN